VNLRCGPDSTVSLRANVPLRSVDFVRGADQVKKARGSR